MDNDKKIKKWIYVRWFLLRAILVIYDIVTINFAFFLALLIRFYVANEFHEVAASYLEAYRKYAPVYIAICIIIYAFFKLYSGILKHAGFNDLSRIVVANFICAAIHVAGTLLFIKRMPISYYVIGGLLQLAFTVVSRFAYRIYIVERSRFSGANKTERINTMVIGAGEIAKTVICEMNQDMVAKPVCILNHQSSDFGYLLDGLPVINGIDKLEDTIKKFDVKLVVVASPAMPYEMRQSLRERCIASEVTIQDYTGFLQTVRGGISLRDLAECYNGKIDIIINGSKSHYDDLETALMNVGGKFAIKSMVPENGTLTVELGDSNLMPNDLSAEWVQTHKQETGEDISFF